MHEPVMPLPELPECVAGRVADALLERLQADPVLQAVVVEQGGEIRGCDLASLLRQATIKTPSVYVAVRGRDLSGYTSSYGGVQDTALELVFATTPSSTDLDHQAWLRPRLEAHLETLVRAQNGELYEGEVCIAKATTGIRAVSFDVQPLPSGIALTVLGVVYQTDIDLASQEIL